MLTRLANEEDRGRWNEFVEKHPTGSFLQSWQWGELQRELSLAYFRLIVEAEGKIQAVALVLKRNLPLGKSWLYVPRGPLFIDDHAWNSIKDAIIDLGKKEKAIFIKIDPLTDTKDWLGHSWRKATAEIQPQHTLLLDLNLSEEEMLSGMHQKTRYNVRLAEKKGVRIEFSKNKALINQFIKLSHDTKNRGGFRYHADEYYRAMFDALSKGGMFEIGVAKYDDDILAVNLMVSFKDTVTYVHGASASKKRDLMAPNLLQWEAIKRAKSNGFSKYDFFGVAPEGADSNHAWAGFTRFKLGFGGKRAEYIGTYDYVLDSTWYLAIKFLRKLKRLV